MKILHVINENPENNILNIINEQKKENDVEVFELPSGDFDYGPFIDKLVACDRVVSWVNIHSMHRHPEKIITGAVPA